MKDIDLTAVLWLTQFNDKAPLDPRIEVFGGRLEFPAYGFGFSPEVGTLVIHPAGPHFIWAVSQVQVGSLHQARFNITGRTEDDGFWNYNPQNFPGDWKAWLNEYF